ncbi:MAG: YybH family protein [Limisphaerales bacterium]
MCKRKETITGSTLLLGCILALAGFSAPDLKAADANADADPREAAITKTAEAFVEAFHKGDARALADFWTTDGDYVDDTGRAFKGRDAIEKSFTAMFAANKGAQLRIDVASLKFPTQDVAVEDGTTTVTSPDGSAPMRARYTNVLLKQGDKWLLSSVREAPDSGPSNYEFLRGLGWAIGEWVDDVPAESPAAEVGHLDIAWAPGQNFIVATRTVDFKDDSHVHSTQWIGWDAAAKQIRSWSFQADGGFGESTWTKDSNKWIVKTQSVLADGKKVTSSNIITPVDADTLTWQARDQKANGQALPDTKEVKMKRVD